MTRRVRDRRRAAFAAGLLLLGACGEGPFSPYPRCEVDCPLPPTVGPTAFWVHPAPGGPVRVTDILHVSATDDIRVKHVEFYWFGLKIHAGVVAGPPYTVPWVGYPGINVNYQDGAPVELVAVATDVEGNADTVTVIAVFETDPPGADRPPEGQ